jgi:thiol-disulfide isomerase/thioredoxin
MKMGRWLVLSLLASAWLYAQENLSQAEQQSLQKALGEAGNSPVDFVRVAENHLKQYPNSPKKAELERALLKYSIDLKDDARTIRYGETALAREPDNLQLLESVATSLLHQGDKANAEKALEHSRHAEQLIVTAFKDDKFAPGGGRAEVARKEQYDRGLAGARLIQARALGLLERVDEAIRVAESSYDVFPSVEAAREAARWLISAGKDRDAIQYLANAFAISGLHSADSEGANDRARMSELYRKLNGSEAGLGDLILKAYDNTSNLLEARRTTSRQFDPNSQIKDLTQFTLSSLDGDPLKLSSLAGKVVVLDFWATWCIPCRAQHPLYEAVKANFKDSDGVVFLSVDTDNDKNIVKSFMEAQKWTQKVYFEDGLVGLLQVADIPTTIILGKKGNVTSRMTGFIPDRFVEMLTDRIDEALGNPPRPRPAKTPSEPIPPPTHQ